MTSKTFAWTSSLRRRSALPLGLALALVAVGCGSSSTGDSGAGAGGGTGGATASGSGGETGSAAGPFACGSEGLTCDGATQVCVETFDAPMANSLGFSCNPIPTACTGNPTCQCVVKVPGYNNCDGYTSWDCHEGAIFVCSSIP